MDEGQHHAVTTVLRVIGDIDAATVPAIKAQADLMLSAAGLDELRIDFGAATSVDSTGLGMLVWLRGACLDAGITLVIARMAPRMRTVLGMVGLDAMFDFVDDEAPAGPPDTAAPPVAAPPAVSGPTADHRFDRFAALAQRVVNAPTALVSFVDQQRQLISGAAGLTGPVAETRLLPLSHSICKYVVATGAPLVVIDARTDPRVAGNPAITDLGVISYAGAPIVGMQGAIVGSLCVTDVVPREWTPVELATLSDLAAACSAELQQREAFGLAAVSEDRDRIARHLHENVTGELLNVSMLLGSIRSISSGHAAQLLDQSLAAIDTVLTNIRAAVFEVPAPQRRPQRLDP